jgi:hypothetical protein
MGSDKTKRKNAQKLRKKIRENAEMQRDRANARKTAQLIVRGLVSLRDVVDQTVAQTELQVQQYFTQRVSEIAQYSSSLPEPSPDNVRQRYQALAAELPAVSKAAAITSCRAVMANPPLPKGKPEEKNVEAVAD